MVKGFGGVTINHGSGEGDLLKTIVMLFVIGFILSLLTSSFINYDLDNYVSDFSGNKVPNLPSRPMNATLTRAAYQGVITSASYFIWTYLSGMLVS